MPPSGSETNETRAGLAYGLAAFGWWGFVFPAFIVAMNAAAERAGVIAPLDSPSSTTAMRLAWSMEVMAQRCLWTLLVCLLLVARAGRWGEVRRAVRSRRRFGLIATTTLLIAANWIGFIIGAATGRLSEVSLGYYINPLLSVALGVLVLGERLRSLQWAAVACAAAGVAWETARLGHAPWIALVVACAFGLYGLLRKQLETDALPGLTVECALMAPLAIGYLVWRETSGAPLAFGRSGWGVSLLIAATGAATAAPLLWFTLAARRLPLSTVAFLQYLTPTGQLLTAILLNDERLTFGGAATFAMIWIGVAAFLTDARRNRASRRAVGAAPGGE
ncbi:EamA-like transporter family protein [Pseudobythopirellula maris]|uniref:EamA-like transporter family protein n=1 Tax=Pseudobythopirellula maris TaxID=2527991 RepID=A0A5C5ZL86_9BACT|nr:EamA family transporter RarD [Pseudobythopirellula maris]TWT88204.1 EamA-like transporter family protein [Pseudobythopirellula maris]